MSAQGEFDVAVVGLGGIGSGAAYWAARRGARVLGLERFELGHERGASQDHSRIIRLSYHAPEYVRFAQDAFEAWAELEADSDEGLIVKTGGIDLFPADGAIRKEDYTGSLDARGIGYELLDATEAMRRWPQWRLPDDVEVLFQAEGGIAPASRCNATHRRMAKRYGATLVENARVASIVDAGGEYELTIDGGERYRAERLIVATDAWTNELLAHFGARINLTVTQEQVAYFAAADPPEFAPDRFPIWIWMGDPSFYGLPSYAGTGVKIGQDVGGGREVTGDTRTFEPDPAYTGRLDGFIRTHLPNGFGPHLEIKSCLYAMPPDREFILDFVPGQDRAVMGQGAAHAFKFASVFGRSLVELVFDGKARSDVSTWSVDRDVLTMDDPPRAFAI